MIILTEICKGKMQILPVSFIFMQKLNASEKIVFYLLMWDTLVSFAICALRTTRKTIRTS